MNASAASMFEGMLSHAKDQADEDGHAPASIR
jgi:hypothetical protein